MPFNFCDPKPPTPFVTQLKEFAKQYETSSDSKLQGAWPRDRYDTTGGSFPVRPSKPCGGCNKVVYNDKDYPANFIRTQLHLYNPSALISIKNTKIVENLMHDPNITFVAPKFVHGPCRSTNHLRVSLKHEKALCAITDNLEEEYYETRRHALRRRTLKFKKFVNEIRASVNMSKHEMDRKEMKRRSSVYVGPPPSSRMTLSQINSSSSSSINGGGTVGTAMLMNICKKGELLRYVRENVAKDMKDLEIDEEESAKFRFPSEAELRFEKGEFDKGPQKFPPDRYAYDPNSGMAMMCAKKRILAEFYESKSDKELKQPTGSKLRDDKLNKYVPTPLNKFKKLEFTPSLLELIAKAPVRSHKGPRIEKEDADFHSHLGLIEESKRDMLRRTVHQMELRNPIDIPKELMTNVYGPIKEIPRGKQLLAVEPPTHLDADVPPTEEELENVEAKIKYKAKVDKAMKRRGSRSNETNQLRNSHYAKPLLSDSDNDATKKCDTEKAEQELDNPQAFIAAHTSTSYSKDSGSLKSNFLSLPFVDYGVPRICGSTDNKVPGTRRRRDLRKIERFERSVGLMGLTENSHDPIPRQVSYDIDAGLSQDSNETAAEDEEDLKHPDYVGAKDSIDSLSYPDVRYSDVEPPSIPEIRELPFYLTLAKDNTYSSTDSQGSHSPEEEEIEEDLESYNPTDNQNNEGLDNEEDNEVEELDETVVVQDTGTQFKTEEDAEVAKRMRELLQHHLDADYVFRTEPAWRKLLTVEAVPPQVNLRDPDLDETAAHWDHLEIIYDHKMSREISRKQREKELREEIDQLKAGIFHENDHHHGPKMVHTHEFKHKRTIQSKDIRTSEGMT